MSTTVPSIPHAQAQPAQPAQAAQAAAAPATISLRRLGLLAALAVLAGALVIFWPRIDAQRRALIVFSETSDPPVVSTIVHLLTPGPRSGETTAGGFPTTLVHPGRGHRWSAVLLLPGPALNGRRNPSVLELSNALARAGYAVFVPDLPGMIDGRLTEATVRATIDAALDIAHRNDVSGGRVALAGSSAGAALALLAAEDPILAPRVSVVAGIGPWASAPNVLRLATTGYVYDGRELRQHEVDPLFSLVAARSLVAALPQGTDRDQLLALLEGVPRTEADPLKVVRGLALSNLTGDAAAVVALLANTHAPSFDNLYAALPESIRSQVDRLSPAVNATGLHAPVELAQAKNDPFAPPGEAALLARTSPLVHVTSTGPVKDGILQPSWSSNAFLVAALRKAR